MNQNKGSAILSALFIMILTAIAATLMTVQLKHYLEEIHLVQETYAYKQNLSLGRYYAMQVLTSEHFESFATTPDNLSLKFKGLTLTSDPKLRFNVEIFDLNHQININQLSNPALKTAFYRLLKHLLEDDSGKNAYQIAHLLSEWVQPYRPGHRENNTRIFAHTPMASLSELKFIPEITPKIYQSILPYITVLPKDSKMNINTISEEILMSLGQNKDILEHVSIIIEARDKPGGIIDLASIEKQLKALNIDASTLTTDGQYFMCVTQAIKMSQNVTIYSLLKRVKVQVNHKEKQRVFLIQETMHTD